MKKKLAVGLSTLLMVHPSFAQFEDDFTDAELDEASPPPPVINSGSGTPNSPSSAAKKGLDAQKREKLARANPEDITDENFPETIDSFDFPNADITDVIKAISELTGRNFILDSGVQGKITIVAPTKISVAEAYKAFLSALAMRGYTVVPSGAFWKIKNSRNAQTDNIETYSGAYFPNTDQMITRIIHLKHISAQQVNQSLRNLVSKDGIMYMYEPTNSIILTDYGSNIERVMKILNQLDVQGFEEKLEVIPVRYAKAKDLAELIDKIVNKGEKKNTTSAGGFSSGVPRFGRTSGGQGGTSYFMVFPDDRTNALIAVGNKAGMERLRKLIHQLDYRIRPEDAGGVYVYYVKYGDAEKIAATMTGLAKDSGTPARPGGASTGGSFGGGAPSSSFGGSLGGTQAAQSIFGGDVKIASDKTTNSLIVTASKQDYEVVLSLLSKIDILRDQVYVEAIIMELSLSDSTNYGIGYYQFDSASKGVGRAGFNGLGSGGLTDLLNPVGGQGAVLGFGSGSNVTVNVAGKDQTVKSLTGFINLIKATQKTNILSTPQIMVMDNQEAVIEAGDIIPTSTTQSTGVGGTTSTSVKTEEATIKLQIKPAISPTSNQVRMEVQQSAKQPSTGINLAKNLQDNAIALSTRSIKTNISVPDGDTAVLGGLIKDQESEEISKVPILGDIPILGWLFKSKKTARGKTNLLVFLTPKIIRTQTDQRNVLSQKLDERVEFIRRAGGRDPHGQKMETLRRKTAAVPTVNPRLEPSIIEPGSSGPEPQIEEPQIEATPEAALPKTELDKTNSSLDSEMQDSEILEPSISE